MNDMQGFTRRKPGMGVYSITHLPTGKVYIGCTGNFSLRWTKHRVLLNAGTHHNGPLQRDWQAGGPDHFAFSIIEATADVTKMVAREQQEIDRYLRDTPDLLYNLAPRAHRNTKGAKRSHCVHGHALTDENVYISKDGHRHCRECKRARDRERAVLPARKEQNREHKRRAHEQGKDRDYLLRDPEKWRRYQRDWRRKRRGIPLDRPHDAHPRGDASHATKVSDATVAAIRARVAAGERQNAIAREYGVSAALICRIGKGARRVP